MRSARINPLLHTPPASEAYKRPSEPDLCNEARSTNGHEHYWPARRRGEYRQLLLWLRSVAVVFVS